MILKVYFQQEKFVSSRLTFAFHSASNMHLLYYQMGSVETHILWSHLLSKKAGDSLSQSRIVFIRS